MKCLKYLALSVFLFLISCSKKDSIPFEVTYEVNSLSNMPLSIFIAYNDSLGSTVIRTTEKKWNKKVTLQPNQLGSLAVMFSYDWNIEHLKITPLSIGTMKEKIKV
jgi:hypothetical protein